MPVVSGGGTPALKGCGDFPMLTEHRAGTYVYNDVMRSPPAPRPGTIAPCGARDRGEPPDRGPRHPRRRLQGADLRPVLRKGYGRIVEYPERGSPACPRSTASSTCRPAAERPKIGEVVSVIPNHCCVVSNMMDEVYAARNGVVEVVWPVAARGKVR